MAVDITDLTDFLINEVSPPGTDLFPEADAGIWELTLGGSFWELVLEGLITGYVLTDASLIVEDVATPVNDLPRELQQLIVLHSAVKTLRLHLMNVDTLFRAHAGPVEYETQKSSSVLKGILESLERRYARIISDLADSNTGVTDYYIDPYTERSLGTYDDSGFIGY